MAKFHVTSDAYLVLKGYRLGKLFTATKTMGTIYPITGVDDRSDKSAVTWGISFLWFSFHITYGVPNAF